MKKIVSTCTISLLALCNSFFGDMLELNVDNFEQTVKSLKKPLVVEVYSTRCSHCKHMAPIYEELKYIGSMTKEELEENLLEFLGEK
jgi:thioredoxin-like negative regulator of GroEL